MKSFTWNGAAFEVGQDFSGNRGFLYGDGFFETILISDGIPAFWELHMNRARTTADYLRLPFLSSISLLTQTVLEVIHKEKINQARMRLSFFRMSSGKYHPEKNELGIYLQLEPLNDLTFNLLEPKSWAWAQEAHHYDPSNRYKLIGKVRQVRYALMAADEGLDDLILWNTSEDAVSCIAGNLMVFDGQDWLTPHVASGALMGTMRRALLDAGCLISRPISKLEVEQSHALASMNSIEGIRAFASKEYENDRVKEIQKALDQLRVNSIQDFQGSLP